MNKALSKDAVQLCPNCKTGLGTYLVDRRSPFCPYIFHHNGTICSKFVPLNAKRQYRVQKMGV